MQTKPKAIAFLGSLLEEAGFRKGHIPLYIKELYPELHEYLTDGAILDVPEDRFWEFEKIQHNEMAAEELEQF